MNKIQARFKLGSTNVRTSISVALLAAAAAALWFSASSPGLADNNCTVCHKGTQTLVLTCNSLEYRRHKDHGDPDGACAATSSELP